MAKASKPKKKRSKYDITVKTDLSPDELLKLAAISKIKNNKTKKK